MLPRDHQTAGLTSLSVAVIEDSPDDQTLIERLLRLAHPGRDVTVRPYRALADGMAGLSRERADVMLLDLHLPDSAGLDTVASVVARHPRLPVIVLTSLDDERMGEAAVSGGAQDFLPKDRLDPARLARSVAYAILRKDAENVLHLAHEEARRVAQIRDDMNSMIHHDIGSPLTAARGALVILQNRLFGPYDAQYDKYVDIAAKNLEIFSRLVCDLRDVTLYSDRGFSVRPSWTGFRDCAETAWMEVREEAESHGISFSIRHSGADRVWADPQRLTQILGNLFRNAARFAGSRIELRLQAGADGATIEVENDGRSFDETDLQSVFEKFYRGRQNGSGRPRGSGLGLAIVKLLAQAHGGSVSARNGSMGACVSVFLPGGSPADTLAWRP